MAQSGERGSGQARSRPWRWGWAAIVAILAISLGPLWPRMVGALKAARPHAPSLELLSELPVQTRVHIAAALAALLVGAAILSLPKGRGPHKALGWTWVVAMAATAVSSLFITGLNGDAYSLVHLLSGWTIVALPLAIWAIRNGNVSAHRRAMTALFVGGLVVAGALTFLPGRFMFRLFFG